eukprot:819901-Rhodomonas_salina.2
MRRQRSAGDCSLGESPARAALALGRGIAQDRQKRDECQQLSGPRRLSRVEDLDSQDSNPKVLASGILYPSALLRGVVMVTL